MNIEIINFKLRNLEDKGSMIGVATALVNSCIVVKGIKLMQGKNGPFVSMPNYKAPGKDEWADIAYLKTKENQELLREEIKKAYSKAVQTEEHRVSPFSIILTPLPGRVDALRAIGNVNVDGLVVRNVKLMESNGKLFISMPQFKDGDGKWHDLVYPNNAGMRGVIEAAFTAEYEKKIKEMGTMVQKSEQENRSPDKGERKGR